MSIQLLDPTTISANNRDDQNAGLNEVEVFMAAHPLLESIESPQRDINGVFPGKWAPASSPLGVFRDRLALPMSIFGLDV